MTKWDVMNTGCRQSLSESSSRKNSFKLLIKSEDISSIICLVIILGSFNVVILVFFSLGLLDEELIDKRDTPLDTLSNYLAKRLNYGE